MSPNAEQLKNKFHSAMEATLRVMAEEALASKCDIREIAAITIVTFNHAYNSSVEALRMMGVEQRVIDDIKHHLK